MELGTFQDKYYKISSANIYLKERELHEETNDNARQRWVNYTRVSAKKDVNGTMGSEWGR